MDELLQLWAEFLRKGENAPHVTKHLRVFFKRGLVEARPLTSGPTLKTWRCRFRYAAEERDVGLSQTGSTRTLFLV